MGGTLDPAEGAGPREGSEGGTQRGWGGAKGGQGAGRETQGRSKVMSLQPLQPFPSFLVFHSLETFEEYRSVIFQGAPQFGFSKVSSRLDSGYAFLAFFVRLSAYHLEAGGESWFHCW